MNLRTSIVVLGVAALLGFLLWGLIQKGESRLPIGEPVPVATLPTLPAGDEGSLEDYRGQWVLLNIWASWCDPCRDEGPYLHKFDQKHGEQVTLLGVNTKDPTDDGLAFMKEFDMTFPQLRDSSGDYTDGELKATGVPESFLIDPEGKLVAHQPGPFADEAAVEKFARPALQDQGGAG